MNYNDYTRKERRVAKTPVALTLPVKSRAEFIEWQIALANKKVHLCEGGSSGLQ